MPLSDAILLLMALLAIGVLVRDWFAKLPIPYTVMLVLIGMLLGSLARSWTALEPIRYITLSPDLVFFVFLPVLIFESGLSLNARQLTKDIIPVLTLAIPALLLSTALVGLGVWLLTPLDLTTALLFGALISATDPVAVVSIFKELGTPIRLTTLVEGESLFNDATAIVLFSILLGLAINGGFVVGDIGLALIEFVKVFLGGALLGFVIGLLVSRMLIRMQMAISSVLLSSLIMAYVAFILAEHYLHVSGVMAVVTAALSFALIASPRLSQDSTFALHNIWEFLADIINTLLFLLIGMAADLKILVGMIGLILAMSVIVIAARGLSVYSFVPLTVKLFKLPTITLGERHVMWWGGLKGGLAIAIVLSVPIDFPGRELLLNLTLGIVLFSLLVNAPTIRPLIVKLGMDKLSEHETVELKQTTAEIHRQVDSVLQRLLTNRVLSRHGHYQARQEVEQSLHFPTDEISTRALRIKERLDTLREESRELDDLFYAGVVQQYSYLDLKAELQIKRGQVVHPQRIQDGLEVPGLNLFNRLETWLIHHLRENNRASNLLARYQNMRISQHIDQDLTRIVMAEAAVDYSLKQSETNPLFDPSILPGYYDRLKILHGRISSYQRDFEQFYRQFETRFAKRAALISVLRYIQKEKSIGVINNKVFGLLDREVRRALDKMPAISEPVQELETSVLISLVPLFAGLSKEALKIIATKASSVNYLAGDVIIGEGEHGDALYIVVKGRVQVTHESDVGHTALADLVVGDFFGEIALLGDHVRNATVTAIHASTLLRLTARDVNKIALQIPEIGVYLNRLKKKREVKP